MFSCGPTSDRRKIDIQNWIAKGEYDLDDSIICIEEDIDLGPFSKAGAVPNAGELITSAFLRPFDLLKMLFPM